MNPRISTALKKLDRENNGWNGEGDAPQSWWLAVDGIIDVVAASPATLALDELHLCEPAVEAINGYVAGLGAVDRETGEPITAPHKKLLSGIGRILSAVPQTWPPLETVEMLIQQDVPRAQIAAMHGLTLHQVNEIALGKAKYPAGHVTPHVIDQRKRQKDLRNLLRVAAARWNAQKAIEREFAGQDGDDCDGYDDRELSAPEMLANGASVGEVADHFDVDPDAIIDEVEGTNLEVDESEEAAIDDEIISLHSGGMGNADIADVVGVSVQRAAAVVRMAIKAGMVNADSHPVEANAEPVKRGRGRPRKADPENESSTSTATAQKIRRANKAAAKG